MSEKTKKALKEWLALAGFFITSYAIVGFIVWDVNAGNWSGWARACAVITTICC